MTLYDRITNPALLVRRITITACQVQPEGSQKDMFQQLDLFADMEQEQKNQLALEREKRRQKAVIAIKQKYGKNAILKGMNFQVGATTRERNGQVGGHRA